ncbi:sigma-70 family RNA polymerase sigma factor [Aurantiacibacter zhengii]|uniref:RNA polymerase sigma factor n=1 Tax=Aurantiacibacter zhengii TaxID=2307003 RepID=A0A418NQG6_9SPHN|nr:sigma-70 family RNA polymerase sigma factor [Aurantiacibacter zhengii]RIV84991.1 sigma-70 family RNA polymerase sigma factor [Aurantiacibacter zhengii]
MGTANELSRTDRRAALEEAMQSVADGKQEALQHVYDLTSAKLLGVIIQVVRDRETAEDVLQETYIKVWSRAGRFDRTRASPITWLCAIARNSAIDAVRKVGRRGEIGDDALPEIADESPDADKMLCDAEESERLKECLDTLQQDHRRCIRMAFFRGFTHSELASRLKVPLGTMKSWIRRGLVSLKGCLDHG